MRIQTRLIFLFLATFTTAALSNDKKLEPAGAFANPAASESAKNALEPVGYRVVDEGGTLCEVWFRKAVPTRAKNEAPGVAYGQLGESTFLGVITFPKNTRDYKGRPLKAGTYTMRYELHPADGDHMGIAPNRDFVLLNPLAQDQDVNAEYQFEDLVKLSKSASGSAHPSPLSLPEPPKVESYPALSENDQGHLMLVVKLKTQSGSDLPLALIVKGVSEH
jgi:hypothetical protein